ncbi:uncharacterized protein [Halyomorpha halys]|nr:uncharacterized protein LOC106688840 isoform X2 [Halyomorpha halys]XP_024214736.1 uncharacterized protein LOC106688840 isoform X2 [Halyomorpha halys]
MNIPESIILSIDKTTLPPLQRVSKKPSRRYSLYTPDVCETIMPPHTKTIEDLLGTQHLIGKKSGESIRSESILLPCMSSDPHLRITQLEQNLRFLQEQHHSMLSSLHQEIESLRIRNRDLQFQLIFGNPGNPIIHSSSDSSPDDSKPKIVLTPKEVNTRPLQVEILEKEVSELKTALLEANSKNSSLTQLVDYQKKQIEIIKKEKDTEHQARLDDAENLIKRLIKENEEQRKEVNTLRSQINKGSGSGNRYNGGRRNGDYQRFPPLQAQTYWGNGSQKHRTSPEYHNARGQLDQEVVGQPAPALPHLTRTYSQPSQNQRHRYYSNGNHFYHGDEGDGRRRYRGRGGSGNHKDDN